MSVELLQQESKPEPPVAPMRLPSDVPTAGPEQRRDTIDIPPQIADERSPDTDMIRPDRFLSAQTLADPKSAGARKALRQLAPSERIVQLCNLEAMAQVHAWKAALQPDFLIAYAFSDPVLSSQHIAAEGAAFRSNRQWYRMAFDCAVSADLTGVAAFAFRVGAIIPKDQWQDHNLVIDDGPAD